MVSHASTSPSSPPVFCLSCLPPRHRVLARDPALPFGTGDDQPLLAQLVDPRGHAVDGHVQGVADLVVSPHPAL